MHHFLIAFFKKPSARNALVQRLGKGVEHLVPYVPGQMHFLALSEEAVFVSTQAHDFLRLGARHLKHGRDFVTFDGFCHLATREAQTAEVFFRAFQKHGGFHLNDYMSGEYCAAYYSADTRKLTGVSDFTGLRPLYYFDNADCFAVSNRQMFLNPLLTGSDRVSVDFNSAADLVSKGNKFSDRSILKGVRMLRPGFCIEFSHESGIELGRSGAPIFCGRGQPARSDYLRSVADIVSNFDALDNFPGLEGQQIRLSLTGGEDSRLALSAALNSRIADRIETFTYGFPDNPDIAAAEMVARKAGVPHIKNIQTPPKNTSERPIADIWLEMTRHAFRFEGAPGAWDGGAGAARQVRLDLVGYFDAYFKRVRPSSAEIDVTSLEVAQQFMKEPQQPFDPLGVLTPESVAGEEQLCNEWLEETLAAGAELNDIPELFYFDFRLPWWGGAMASNVGSLYRIAPLASKVASRTGLKQTVKDRRERKFIFEAMLLLRPDLLELPYLNKKWPDHFQAQAKYVPLPGVMLQLPASQNVNPTLPWPLVLARRGGGFLLDYIHSHDFSELWNVIDLPRLSEILSNPKLIDNTPKVRSIINICEIMILAAGEQKCLPDIIENSGLTAPRITTDIPELESLALRATRDSKTAA